VPRSSRLLSRTETLAALRSLAKRQASVTHTWLYQHNRPLLRGAVVHFESLSAARRAAGMRDPVLPRKWSTKRVVEHLRAAYDAGNSTRIMDLKDAGYGPLISATPRYTGGIRRARLLAGIPEPKRRRGEPEPWDELAVILEILDRWRVGAPLAHTKAPAKLVNAGMRIFGSWGAAIEEAGLDYDRIRLVRRAYTADEIVELLHQLARERPEMSWGDLHEHNAWGAMARHFGSVQQAVRAAGLTGWPMRRQTEWDRASVLRELKRRASVNRYVRLPSALIAATQLYFGSVRAARTAAGLPQLRVPWTRQSIIEEMRARAQRGEAVGSTLASVCRRHFGSVPAAKRAAGISPKPSKWSRERVLQVLRDNAARGDLVIDNALGDACNRYFGSWPAARRAAGIASPRERMMSWSRERLLAELRRRVGVDVPIGKSLGDALRHHFKTVPAARVAAGLPSTRSTWTKPLIIEAIRKLDGKSIHKANPSLAVACQKQFGSIDAARIAAGLAPSGRIRWSRTMIIRELRDWAQRGRPRLSSKLCRASSSFFGSLEAACGAAGVAPRVQRWTPARILDRLKDAARTKARLPVPLALACRRYFGSITAARAAAGVSSPYQRWSRKQVLDELRARDRRGLRGVDAPLLHACRRYFGTVAAAKKAAGVALSQRSWSRAQVIREIRRRWRDKRLTDAGLGTACRRLFGSLAAARTAAGLAPLQRTWSRSDVIVEVRRHARAREPLPSALQQPCRKWFGSINAARLAAGVPIVRMTWTRDDVLTGIRRADRRGAPLDRKLRFACRSHFGSVARARSVAYARR
jgi:hypothetical protein